MAKQERFEELADKLPELVGGRDNISFFTHCITRLRFNVKDKSLVQVEEIEKLDNIVGCQWQGDQFQVIIGQAVNDAYRLICEKTGLNLQEKSQDTEEEKKEKKKFSIWKIFETIAGCITPLIPLLLGAGMIKILVLVLEMVGLVTAESPTYLILSFVGDSGFYFLPIFAGAAAAKKFNANQGLGMMIGAMLLYPSFVEMIGSGAALSVFKIPIYNASYAYSIFPVILAVFIMSHVQHFFAKYSPDAIRAITEPMLTLLVMIPVTFCAVGPLGSFLGIYLADGIMWIYNTFGFIAVALLATISPYVVMTGMHTAFDPFLIQMMSTLGYEPILITTNIISNFNQGAASAAVAVKSKDEKLKSTAASCALTAMVGGVTEPAMYGVTLKYKTPMYGAMIGSFCGGLFAGLMKCYAYAYPGSVGLFGLPIYITDNISNLVYMVIAVLIGIVATFVSTLILYKEQ